MKLKEGSVNLYYVLKVVFSVIALSTTGKAAINNINKI